MGVNLSRRLAVIALIAVFCGSATGATLGSGNKSTVLVLGDSISAEYGLPRDTGWVKLLADRLRQKRPDYNVVNASISGETTSGGRTRLPRLLAVHRPAVVVIELGGNDGLRGLSLAATEENLNAMILAAKQARAQVLLVGMQLPPNYGKTYTTRFAALYPEIARRHGIGLVPFAFAGFAERIEYFQADRIHPAQSAQPLILDNVWPGLVKLL